MKIKINIKKFLLTISNVRIKFVHLKIDNKMDNEHGDNTVKINKKEGK
mgnify:CR=1 FL=1